MAATAAISISGDASAATAASFSCTANAVTTQVAGGSVLNPITAGGDGKACQTGVAGFPNTGEALTLESAITARTAYALTDPGGAIPSASKPTAAAGIEGLEVLVGGPLLGVDAARSSITGSCAGGSPKLEPTSQVATITLAGTPIVLDGVVQPITDPVTTAAGALVEVKLNEVIDLPGGGKAVRAAHITLVRGTAPVADVIVAESRLGLNGAPCADGTGTGDGGNPASVCPAGSVYYPTGNVCVILGPGGNITGPGSVVVGRPSSGPSGGEVMSLTKARKRFPRSRCLHGRGPRYAIIGTKGKDRITGTNRRDRILSLRGSDRVDAGRKRDCVEGGRGKDFVTGGQGPDRMHGNRGRDIVNGDGGNDRLRGGRGKDTLNAAYGRDKAWGGRGNDKINVATAGRRATVFAGRGKRDKVRCNPRELKRIHGAEIIKVTRPYKG
jgi:Ca2+-binding RTX toxin-like protein